MNELTLQQRQRLRQRIQSITSHVLDKESNDSTNSTLIPKLVSLGRVNPILTNTAPATVESIERLIDQQIVVTKNRADVESIRRMCAITIICNSNSRRDYKDKVRAVCIDVFNEKINSSKSIWEIYRIVYLLHDFFGKDIEGELNFGVAKDMMINHIRGVDFFDKFELVYFMLGFMLSIYPEDDEIKTILLNAFAKATNKSDFDWYAYRIFMLLVSNFPNDEDVKKAVMSNPRSHLFGSYKVQNENKNHKFFDFTPFKGSEPTVKNPNERLVDLLPVESKINICINAINGGDIGFACLFASSLWDMKILVILGHPPEAKEIKNILKQARDAWQAILHKKEKGEKTITQLEKEIAQLKKLLAERGSVDEVIKEAL